MTSVTAFLYLFLKTDDARRLADGVAFSERKDPNEEMTFSLKLGK